MLKEIEIQGLFEPRFEAVKEAFTRNFEEGMEVGASFAVTIGGKYVIDIWGGDTKTKKELNLGKKIPSVMFIALQKYQLCFLQ